MMNQYFGEMEYATGWKTKRQIELFGNIYDIVVKIQAYDPEDDISEKQDQACRVYIENEKENLECMEKLMLEYSADAKTRFSPRRLLFDTDGGCALLCNDVLYCCSASRPATEGETTEESKSVKTEKLSLKASALPNGLVKSKTCESTDQTTYDNWYNAVYMPTAATNNSTGTRSASTKSGGTAAAATE